MADIVKLQLFACGKFLCECKIAFFVAQIFAKGRRKYFFVLRQEDSVPADIAVCGSCLSAAFLAHACRKIFVDGAVLLWKIIIVLWIVKEKAQLLVKQRYDKIGRAHV